MLYYHDVLNHPELNEKDRLVKSKPGTLSTHLQIAIEVLPRLDIPAKGRIAHHIRMGRIQRALTLLDEARQLLRQHVWKSAKPVFLTQLSLLQRIEDLLSAETSEIN